MTDTAFETSIGSFWNQLLHAADSIDASVRTPEELHGILLALEEGYSGMFDPAEQFPEYSAILLCRAIRRRLESLPPPAPSGTSRPGARRKKKKSRKRG